MPPPETTRPAAPSSAARSRLVMASGTLLSRVTGLLRTMATAWVLGTTVLADLYTYTNTTPNQVYELMIGGVLTSVLVPLVVEQLTKRGGDDGWREVANLFWVGLALGVAGSVLLALGAPALMWLSGPKYTGADHAIGVLLIRLFSAQILFYALTALANAVLNAKRHFAVPAFAPVLNNLIVIGVLALFGMLTPGGRPSTGLVLLLGLGTTAGIAAMGLVTVPALRIVVRRSGGSLRFSFDLRSPVLSKLLRLSLWTVLYVATNQVGLVVVQRLAQSPAGHTGDMAAWTFAFQFFQLPNGVFAVSIFTVLLPALAESVALEDMAGFRERFAEAVRLTAFLVLPTAVLLFFLSDAVISTALQYGNLTAAGAAVTAGVLRYLVVGLVPYTTFLLVLRSFYAMQDTRSPFLVNMLATAFAIVADYLLYPYMRVDGLALAYSLSYVVAVVVGWWALSRRARGMRSGEVLGAMARIAAACVPMALAVWLVRESFRWLGGDWSSGIGGLAEILVGSLVGACAFLAFSYLFGVGEVRQIRRLLSRRRGRGTPSETDRAG